MLGCDLLYAGKYAAIVFAARLGTASRRNQSSMKSPRVGSAGLGSSSASRARHPSTKSRTPDQPPVSLADETAVAVGLPSETDDVRRAELAGVVDGCVDRSHQRRAEVASPTESGRPSRMKARRSNAAHVGE
jgi:hypothetical protein